MLTYGHYTVYGVTMYQFGLFDNTHFSEGQTASEETSHWLANPSGAKVTVQTNILVLPGGRQLIFAAHRWR
jgi:hypothetical protein